MLFLVRNWIWCFYWDRCSSSSIIQGYKKIRNNQIGKWFAKQITNNYCTLSIIVIPTLYYIMKGYKGYKGYYVVKENEVVLVYADDLTVFAECEEEQQIM